MQAGALDLGGRRPVGEDPSPNAASAIRTQRVRPLAVWGMLGLRSGLLLAFQSAGAALFALGGAADPWRASADWWLGWLLLANVVNLALLARLVRAEGMTLRDLYRIGPAAQTGRRMPGEIGWLVLVLVVSGPLAMLPSVVVGGLLWADPITGSELSFRAIPVPAAIAILVVLPVVHALGELPTYFGYVLPRLKALYGRPGVAVVVTATILSVQHVFLPLLPDWRFIAWRAVMFLPFALWLGFALARRPATLPYLVVGHALLDASLPIFVLIASV